MKNTKANVGRMETRIARLGARAKLDQLKATNGFGVAYRKHIDDVKSQHKAARKTLDQLKIWNVLDVAYKKLTT